MKFSNNQIDFSHYKWCKDRFYLQGNDYSEQFCRPIICPITAQLFGLKPCECNQIGSENFNCEKYVGRCKCKMNVEGRKCDSCARETFGLSTTGCQCKFL
jgi:hypothetical protein